MARRRTIVGIGEALLAEHPDREEPAGLAPLVAINAILLGHRGLAISRLGQDDASVVLCCEWRIAFGCCSAERAALFSKVFQVAFDVAVLFLACCFKNDFEVAALLVGKFGGAFNENGKGALAHEPELVCVSVLVPGDVSWAVNDAGNGDDG